jgi:hypothetical protein
MGMLVEYRTTPMDESLLLHGEMGSNFARS